MDKTVFECVVTNVVYGPLVVVQPLVVVVVVVVQPLVMVVVLPQPLVVVVVVQPLVGVGVGALLVVVQVLCDGASGPRAASIFSTASHGRRLQGTGVPP